MASKNTTQKKPKRFATHVTTPTGDRVYISAKSQEELDKKVLQAKMEMGVGVDIADNTKFEDYARIWLRAYKAPPKIRLNSYENIEWNLEHNVIPHFKGLTLKAVKPMHIQTFLSAISGSSYSVQSKCLQMVRNIFRSAEDNGLIYKSPIKSSDKAGGAKAQEKEPLTNEQAAQLLDSLKGTRAYLFCLLALSTGMRRGEILGLMWEDVDLDSGHINVTHNKAIISGTNDAPVTTMLKTDSSRRRLPIPPLLRQALVEEQKSSSSPYVLCMEDGRSLTKNAYMSLWNCVKRRTASESRPLGTKGRSNNGCSYEVVLDFHCHPHLLRHTYITQLFESGMDIKQVQYLAGHSTPDMTLRVYTHYRQKAREQETTDKVCAATAYLSEPLQSSRRKQTAKIVEFPSLTG